MGNECCNSLDLRREVCEKCPNFSNCSNIITEAIQEVFEEQEETKKIDRDSDVI